MLAIKPQALPKLSDELRTHLTADHVVISIMAGVRLAKLAEAFGGEVRRLVRVMPNTPMMVGQGMSAIALAAEAKAGDDELAMQVLQRRWTGGACGRVEDGRGHGRVRLGAGVRFLPGRGDGAQARELGLGEQASTFVQQTLLGAAHLLAESKEDASELRRRVTSPGGTTEAAIKHLDAHDADRIIIDAVKAAAARSEELGR